jgi:hypothetical protein
MSDRERVEANVIQGLIEASDKDPGSGAWIVGSISREVLALREENDRVSRALLYLADCHAATAEMEGSLKRTSQRSKERFARICGKAAEMLDGVDLLETKRVRRENALESVMDRCRRAAENA